MLMLSIDCQQPGSILKNPKSLTPFSGGGIAGIAAGALTGGGVGGIAAQQAAKRFL